MLRTWLSRPRWWHEVALILIFYALYSAVRNVHGSILSITTATSNAADIIRLEKALNIFNEREIQHQFLDDIGLVKFLNAYYGSAHFIVTIGVLLWLFRYQSDRYRRWRNGIFMTTGLALIGYMTYPLAPPRFLPGFVDTLQTIGGLWSFESGPAAQVSNQYAAMPSLHVAWAVWCVLAVTAGIKNRPLAIPLFAYPVLTTFTIVVTGNHYWADVAGGLLVLGLGLSLSWLLENRFKQWSTPITTATRHVEHTLDAKDPSRCANDNVSQQETSSPETNVS